MEIYIITLLIIIGVFLIFKTIKIEKTTKKPEGFYMGQGIAIGIPLGIPVGLAMGNIALGIALGAAIGVAIGATLEKKHKHNIIQLTKAEKETKKKKLLILSIIGFVVFLFFTLLYLR